MYYTDSHEWVKIENGIGVVGISEFARRELGEVVYVELPQKGMTVSAKQEIAVLESTKAAADIYSPVSGVIVEINHQLKTDLGKLNLDPERGGWMYKIQLSEPDELDQLLTYEQYASLVH
jgi:glycine cleavage system H protein